jgi:hypothetical protein
MEPRERARRPSFVGLRLGPARGGSVTVAGAVATARSTGDPHVNNSRVSEKSVASNAGTRYALDVRHFFTVDSKKKLWRPCREARALGL